MVLGREIIVDDRVDILKVQAARVSVQLVGLGVRTVEMTTTSLGRSVRELRLGAGGASHEPHKSGSFHCFFINN